MPVGGGGKPAGGYRAGKKGSYGCDGYPTVSADGTVHGCHPTKAKAQAQARAIWASVNKNIFPTLEKANVSEGDFVIFLNDEDEIEVGRVEHVMTEGIFGLSDSEYSIKASPEDPVLSVRCYENEDGIWEEEAYSIGVKSSEVIRIESIKVWKDSIVEMSSSDNGTSGTELSIPDEMSKAEKPNYGEMIKPRKGEPANAQLYARIIREAKDKFDVYPSAVANAWVVQEYKRRGGTYKTNKKDYSTSARERMAESGNAMPDGSFPIANRADLMNAIRSVGRAKDYEKAKAHIIRRAKELNATDMLPKDWNNVARKGMTNWGGSIFDLNPFVK